MKFSKDHEWVESTGTKAQLGVTEFAVESLGDIVFVGLPKVGETFEAEKVIATVESVKTVSDVYTPVSGNVTAINEALADAPELLNEDSYKNWLVELELTDASQLDGLMDADEYKAFCDSL